MSLPVQIQKQVDAAKTIIAEHYGPGEGDTPTEPVANADAPAAPSAEATPPAPPPAAQPQRLSGADEATFEQRWRTLQGIHNATNQKLQGAEARLQALEQSLNALQEARQAPHAPHVSAVSEDDIDTFGTPLIDFTRKLVTEEMAPFAGALQALRAEIASLKGLTPVVSNLVTSQRGTSEEKFFAAIAQQVPDWKQINGDQSFHAWLLSVDPMTGITRQSFLEDAQSSFNAERAVNIFQAWQRETGVVTTPQTANPNPATSELERQVAPGRPTASAAPSPAQGKLWTPADITSFYDDVRRGVYKDRASEKSAMERDLFLAQREGRMARNAA